MDDVNGRKQTENDYLRAIKNRNDVLIQEIYNQFLGKVVGFVIANNGTKTDAKDIFDKAVYQISAWLEREDFTINSTFGGFCLRPVKIYGVEN